MHVLGNRKCGSVQAGGLYLNGGEFSPEGTYKACTALVSPHQADILNARQQVLIGLDATFSDNFAGAYPAPTGSTPPAWKNFRRGVALLDLWGESFYPEAWDMLAETRDRGPNRRITRDLLKSIQFPMPCIMQHGRAYIATDHPDGWTGVAKVLNEIGGFLYWTNPFLSGEEDWDDCLAEMQLVDQPWRHAPSLGRKGDPDYFDHSYTELYAILPKLREARKLSEFTNKAQLSFRPGICGLTWFMRAVYVLHEDENEVPDDLAAWGVEPAISASDPRAAEYGEEGGEEE